MGNKLDKLSEGATGLSGTAGGKKKHVCVIGSGASGLIVMKELTALGHTVECFELLPTLGGVYVK